ncbi:uncharacterized protein LOC144421974 [Styela clava]
MGFLQLFFLPMKKLMQRLCVLELGWDDAIPPEYKRTWTTWKSCLPQLESVTIPRCVKSLSGVTGIELHCFCDASELGYGSVCYMRTSDGTTNCVSFVMGKSRVSPSKPMTIPRLELSDAVVGVKLARLIVEELELSIDRVVYWTDSLSVLQYINNKSRRFQVFIANRIALINKHTTPDQWRHVDFKRNPADLASRGLMPDKVNRAELWFNGPLFLRESEAKWPIRPVVLALLNQNEPELKKEARVNISTQETVHGLDQLFVKYSSFTKLLRAVIWILRFIRYLKASKVQ